MRYEIMLMLLEITQASVPENFRIQSLSTLKIFRSTKSK